MTLQEFSTEFDILYNNITSNQAPGLNEYEKSVFLTKAQVQLVSEYFNNRVDSVGGGFDGSHKRQYDFSSLLDTEELFDVNTFTEHIKANEKLDRRSKVFLFPNNYFLAVSEIISDSKRQYSVIPISYLEYQRLMLKPYNFPVKRAAWRLITSNKNCNYFRECIKKEIDTEEMDTDIDYVFISGWANKNRTMSVTIRSAATTDTISMPQDSISIPTITYSDGSHPTVYVDNKTITFRAYYNNTLVTRRITCNSGWKGSKIVYSVAVNVESAGLEEFDDNDVIEILKLGFTLMKYFVKVKGYEDQDWDTIKTAGHTDGFQMCTAPSKFYSFRTTTEDGGIIGRTFETKIIQCPVVEIIGKFSGELNYKLRYVKTLPPIILDNLNNYGEDITISGITLATDCILPEETHHEILERAVTLAKIAWSGSTATQVAQQRNNNSER